MNNYSVFRKTKVSIVKLRSTMDALTRNGIVLFFKIIFYEYQNWYSPTNVMSQKNTSIVVQVYMGLVFCLTYYMLEVSGIKFLVLLRNFLVDGGEKKTFCLGERVRWDCCVLLEILFCTWMIVRDGYGVLNEVVLESPTKQKTPYHEMQSLNKTKDLKQTIQTIKAILLGLHKSHSTWTSTTCNSNSSYFEFVFVFDSSLNLICI